MKSDLYRWMIIFSLYYEFKYTTNSLLNNFLFVEFSFILLNNEPRGLDAFISTRKKTLENTRCLAQSHFKQIVNSTAWRIVRYSPRTNNFVPKVSVVAKPQKQVESTHTSAPQNKNGRTSVSLREKKAKLFARVQWAVYIVFRVWRESGERRSWLLRNKQRNTQADDCWHCEWADEQEVERTNEFSGSVAKALADC